MSSRLSPYTTFAAGPDYGTTTRGPEEVLPGVHGYLRRAFADVDWAEVIVDRRRSERRQQPCPWIVDRRTTGRRTRPDIDERVRTYGWAIVRLNRV